MADDKKLDEKRAELAKSLVSKVEVSESKQDLLPIMEEILKDPKAMKMAVDYAKAVDAYSKVALKYNNRDDSAFSSAYDADGSVYNKDAVKDLRVFAHSSADAAKLEEMIKAKQVPESVVKEIDMIKKININSEEVEESIQALKKTLVAQDPKNGAKLGETIDRAIPRYRFKGDAIFEEFAAADMKLRKLYVTQKEFEDRAAEVVKGDSKKVRAAASRLMSKIEAGKSAQKDEKTLAQDFSAVDLPPEPKEKEMEKGKGMSFRVPDFGSRLVVLSGSTPEGQSLDIGGAGTLNGLPINRMRNI